ncbi:MAG: D-alanyl-D-alanine carboxypeptidase family protein, partial [Nitriliruptoraceae bacterium]
MTLPVPRRRRIAALVATLVATTMLVVTPVHGDDDAAVDRDAPVITHPELTDALSAESWILVEARTGQVIAEHRSAIRRPVASTIKVLTALTVLQNHDLDDLVTVGDEVRGIGGAGVGLTPGDVWTVEQLLNALIARSGNDAAEVLAVHAAGSRAAFVEQMRRVAEDLGMEPIQLASPSGLDDENLVSARALARLARTALAHDDLRSIVARAVVDLPGEGSVASRNELLTSYRGATGVKTGFTDAAGNSMIASARRGERELVAVVLGSLSESARFADAAALLDVGFTETEAVVRSLHVSARRAGGRSLGFDSPEFHLTSPRGAEPTVSIVSLSDGLPTVLLQHGPALPQEIVLTAQADGHASQDVSCVSIARLFVDQAYDALQRMSVDG